MTFSLKPNTAQRESLMRIADGLVVAIAVVLPWSTSATIIGVGIWALVLIPTIDPEDLKQHMRRPAVFLPVALFALAVIGMLWSPVSFRERIGGVDSFLKLLTIPLLMIQFHRSERGHWVLGGFLLSGLLLLAVSLFSFVVPNIGGKVWVKGPGLPVKDYISQSAIFTMCAFAFFYLAIDAFRIRWKSFGVIFVLVGVIFLADMFFVITSRTALFTIPLLLLLLGFRQFGWTGTAAACVIGVIAAGVVWSVSPNVRDRIGSLAVEIHRQKTENFETPAGSRLNFWTRSIESISEAPIIGHGTGTIRETFRRSAFGEGASALVPVNPHNQTFAVAIQLGLVGAVLLFAMWFSHLSLFFCGAGIASWAGLLLVAQNILGSLVNSHLFDFTHGWMYCIGVGVCGGMAIKQGVPFSVFTPARKVAVAKP